MFVGNVLALLCLVVLCYLCGKYSCTFMPGFFVYKATVCRKDFKLVYLMSSYIYCISFVLHIIISISFMATF